MFRPALEVADIFRDHGAAWRGANAGHVSLDQLKVMSAIERWIIIETFARGCQPTHRPTPAPAGIRIDTS
jgi:hypothetical protein